MSSKCMTETDFRYNDKHKMYAVYLMNMTTNVCIWKALNSQSDGDHLGLIKKVLRPCHDGGENCKFCSQYSYTKEDIIRSQNLNDSQEEAVSSCVDEYSDKMDNIKSFMTLEQFVKKTFCELSEKLKFLIQTLYTHLPKSFISLATVKKMFRAIELLRSIGISLGPAKFKQTLDASEKERIPSCFLPSNSEIDDFLKILSLLSSSILLPELNGRNQIEKFCLSNACLVLCTVSSSIKLYTEGMTQVKFLVIDEAAQLKECESTIPLQLPGLQHCILIGDDKQLPALVKSKVPDY
ncbi:hypothetical protein RYX36_029382 [Vicia faba]